MGKPTGFLDYRRAERPVENPAQRVKSFREFHGELTEEERQTQGARCMNCGVPFCQSDFGCPLHNLVPEWNDEVFHGNWSHALSRLLRTNNFPEFTGRVCPALCESACVCGLYGDAPISVRDNELAIIEHAYAHGLIKPHIPEVRTERKVAVVGSGPAGLAVADQLNQRGHSVTILEKEDRPGGLLMYGIPNMKLDKSVIARRLNRMETEGITFITGTDVTKKGIAQRLLEEFDAVVLCCGARAAREVPVENRDAAGVHQALEYLTESTRSLLEGRPCTIDAAGKNVVVIGNGDTATDCVATAIRQGAVSVTQLVRKPAPVGHGPSWPYHLRSGAPDYGQEEAAAVFGHDPRLYATSAKRLITDETGALAAIAAETEGRDTVIPAELLLIAAGFSGAEEGPALVFGLKLDEAGHLGDGTYHTADPKIFVAGDMRRGASLVVTAIAEGRACAKEVDRFLEGYTNL